MAPFHRILVALCGSAPDEGLLEYGRMLASSGDTELVTVHVRRPGKPAPPLPAGCRVLEGPLEDRILEATLDLQADLLLLGHRTSTLPRRTFARRMAMKAPCSVWMAPEGSPARIRRILVPVDFSSRSADALLAAAAVARTCPVERIQALHVYFDAASIRAEDQDSLNRSTKDIAFLHFLRPLDLRGVEVETRSLESSNVSHASLQVARDWGADLIVMGTRGRSRAAGVLLGSETEQTLLDTPIPLLAVKHFGSRLGLLRALLDPRVQERDVHFG